MQVPFYIGFAVLETSPYLILFIYHLFKTVSNSNYTAWSDWMLVSKKFGEELIAYFPRYDTSHIENHAPNNSSIVACVFVTAITFVSSRCLATIRGFLPSRCLATIGEIHRHTHRATWSHKTNLFFLNKSSGLIMNWKIFGRNWSWPNLKYFPRNSPGGTEENHTKFRQKDLYFVRNSKWAPVECKSEVSPLGHNWLRNLPSQLWEHPADVRIVATPSCLTVSSCFRVCLRFIQTEPLNILIHPFRPFLTHLNTYYHRTA
jgi:hypothetical protein